jgi:hypothetical protein
MRKSMNSILVVGTIRNGERSLQKEIFKCLNALSSFEKVSFYLVESDSTDKSLEILDKLKIMRLSFTGRPTKHESSKVYLKVVFHL